MPKFSEAGPWALVIVFSSFLMKAIIYGITFSIGLYTVEFMKYFDTSATNASLVAAINLGVFRLGGPFVSLLLKKFSYRTVAVGGGILSVIGTLSVVFERDIPSICVSYGLTAGFGFCTCFLLSSVVVGVYFEKYRAIATAISESGGTFGVCVMPFIVNKTIEDYTWRGSFYIISCLTSQLIVLGALLRPPPQLESSIEANTEKQNEVKLYTNVDKAVTLKPLSPEHTERGSPVFSVLPYKEIALKIPDDKTGTHAEPYLSHGKAADELFATSDGNQWHPTTRMDRQSKEGNLRIKQFTKRYFKAFGNLGFVLFTFSWTLYCFSLSAFLSFVPKFLISLGLTANDAAMFMVVNGVACFVVTIMSGLVYNSPCVNAIVPYTIGTAALGVPFLLFNHFQTYYYILTIFIFWGATNGLIVCGRIVIIIDCVGTNGLSDALGFNALASGLGFFIGPPLAGYLYDVTKNFDAMFYCLAAMQCLASLVMVVLLIQRKSTTRNWSVNKK